MSEVYCCPNLKCKHEKLKAESKGLSCPNGCFFNYYEGTTIPILAHAPQGFDEYNVKGALEHNDNHLEWLFSTFCTTEECVRKQLIGKLRLISGSKVLITGAGAGNDIPYIAQALDFEGEIYAQDFSADMLLAAQNRYQKLITHKLKIFFSISDATQLPFAANYFDAVYHFGGLNVFSSPQNGINEMVRVAKDRGSVVFGDEGNAPWLRKSEYSQMLIVNNSLNASEVPLAMLPQNVSNVNVTWILGNTFYVVSLEKDENFPKINIDIPHAGLRGGSIRSRFYGKLDGINPELRDKLNAKAKELGVSRVQFLENAINTYIEEKK